MNDSKKTKKQLVEEVKILRTLIDSLPDRLYVKDAKCRFVTYNKAVAEREGPAPSGWLTGKTDFDLYPPEKASVFYAEEQRIIKGGKPLVNLERAGVDRTGQPLWALITKLPWRDSTGRIIGIIGSNRDITERKKAEEALLESEARYKAIFESASEGILIAEIKTKRLKYANPAICKMLGHTEEELRKMTVHDLHPREHAQNIDAHFTAQKQGGKISSQNIPCLRKDGTVFFVNLNTAGVLIDQRQCSVGFFTDVTRQMQSKQALQESEQRYRLLVEQLPAVTYTAALDQASTTLYVSPQVQEMLGVSQANYRGDPDLWRKMLHPDDRRRVMAEVAASHRTGQPFNSEYRMIARDGRVMWVRDDARIVEDSEGRPLCLQGVMYDITGRKNTEEILRKSHDELETRVRQRTADLAHYQQQLRSLASQLSLAEERLRRRIATELHDHISQNLAISKMRIEALADNAKPDLARSLNEVIDLLAQTIEATRTLTFEMSPPVLYELGFEAAVGWLVRQTRERFGLDVEFCDDGKPKPLDTDVRVLLFQAVRELLVNVVKHASAGKAKVSTKRVRGRILVTVEDDGVGFDARFAREARRASRRRDSSPAPLSVLDRRQGGFGLFNIRERLDHIGGSVDIRSSPGHGTRIILTVPIQKTEDPPSPTRRATEGRPKGLRSKAGRGQKTPSTERHLTQNALPLGTPDGGRGTQRRGRWKQNKG